MALLMVTLTLMSMLNRLVNKDLVQLLAWRLHQIFILGSSLGHRSIRVAS